MRPSTLSSRTALAALGALAALAVGLAPAASAAERYRDLRSLELLDLDCTSDIGRRQTTLFGNGTVRVRTWEGDGGPRMLLKELSPDELDGYLNRLREIDLSESESSRESPSGDWVQQCELELDLFDDGAGEARDRGPGRYSFGRYDSLSLALSRAIRIAEEISAWAEEQAIVAEFPPGYEPRPGDVLERADGLLFEVIAFTSDNRGVELWGVDQPLVVYVLREEVIGEFVRVVEKRGER